jgi:hypothetical protein
VLEKRRVLALDGFDGVGGVEGDGDEHGPATSSRLGRAEAFKEVGFLTGKVVDGANFLPGFVVCFNVQSGIDVD